LADATSDEIASPSSGSTGHQGGKASILVVSDDLERACVALNAAVAAAASDMQVVMFFTCWGVKLVKRENLPPFRGDSIMNRALNFLNRGGASRLRLSRYHWWGLGSAMMRRHMARKGLMLIPDLIREAKELGVRFYVCENPLLIMGLKQEDLIDEVEDIVGVTSYISETAGCDITLFV